MKKNGKVFIKMLNREVELPEDKDKNIKKI